MSKHIYSTGRRRALPPLKAWRHDHPTDDFESYTISLSPSGELIQSRTRPRAVPRVDDVIYTLVRWKNRWHVEYATASATVFVGKNGNPRSSDAEHFSSAASALSIANKHWGKV